MIALLLAAAAVTGGPDAKVAYGQIFLRVISGARVRPGISSEDATARLRRTTIRIEGIEQSARIVEFP